MSKLRQATPKACAFARLVHLGQPLTASKIFVFESIEIANKIQRIMFMVPRFTKLVSFNVHTNKQYLLRTHLFIPNITSFTHFLQRLCR